MGRPIMVYAMEVQACGRISKLVIDIHDKSIAFVDHNRRYWPLIIDADDVTWKSVVRICDDPSDIEIIGDCFGMYKGQQSGQ